jgi:hypothetical protein
VTNNQVTEIATGGCASAPSSLRTIGISGLFSSAAWARRDRRRLSQLCSGNSLSVPAVGRGLRSHASTVIGSSFDRGWKPRHTNAVTVSRTGDYDRAAMKTI